ncbi:MAG TPA: HEAT repeat domain-containing protein [Candidatus Binataceae bacterium]|nr:HEAT repeat domain-containing protein [Candidatus Binataceae bacterium]
MKKRIAIAIWVLTFLYASLAGAQTAAPHPNLETADWSTKQARSLNAEPKKAVWELIDNLLGVDLGKLCSFQFTDLRHSEVLSLAVTYDAGGNADCIDFDVIDKTPAGIEDFDFFAGGEPFFEGIKDINGDGRREVIVGRSFASIGRDHCTAIWPVIYAWDGSGYADVSGQFKGFYRQRLQELTRRLAPSPTPTPVSERVQTFESQPLGGSGPQVRLRMILPQASPTSESESSEETANTGDTDCLKAEAAKIERFLGISSDAGMLDAIKWKNSNNPDDREFAAWVLADTGTAEAIGDLRTLSKDPDPDVAATAQAAMKGALNPTVFPTIQGELLTKDTSAPSAK